jgi:hypothetical protein
MCLELDREFDRLQRMYESVDDPGVGREAWVMLTAISDDWTSYGVTRSALHQSIRDAGLMPP